MVLSLTAAWASGQDPGAARRFGAFEIGPAPAAAQEEPAAVPVAVASDEAVDAAATPEWRFMVGTYLWLPAMSGDVKVQGVESDVSVTLSDSWDLIDENFNGGAILHLEATRERLTFFGDAMYLNLEHQGRGLFGVRDVGFEQGIFELGAAYAVIDRPLIENLEFGLRLEPLAGARINYLDASADFPLLIDFDDDKTWVDGFIGARAQLQLTPSWALFARGDIGAGGSDFVWNTIAGIDIRLADWASFYAGYRALSTDYSSGDFEYDMILYGPFIALGFRF
jgi:hypothetical protein